MSTVLLQLQNQYDTEVFTYRNIHILLKAAIWPLVYAYLFAALYHNKLTTLWDQKESSPKMLQYTTFDRDV